MYTVNSFIRLERLQNILMFFLENLINYENRISG